MEDLSAEIMERDGQLQNPEVNMWYLFKVNLLNTFSCPWTKYTLYIYCLNFFMNQIIVKKIVELMQTKET